MSDSDGAQFAISIVAAIIVLFVLFLVGLPGVAAVLIAAGVQIALSPLVWRWP